VPQTAAAAALCVTESGRAAYRP